MKESLSCLIVDDKFDFSSTFSEILKFEGFDTEYTTSSKEALDMISTNNYDLIFLDVNMPELSGIEMLKQIPKISKNGKPFWKKGKWKWKTGKRSRYARAFRYEPSCNKN